MTIDFTNQNLPPIYYKNGKKCYLDPIRKRLTYVTAEETVRQQVISYLINDIKVPKMMIKSEEPLIHYGINSKTRADIIIHQAENDGLVPIAVIECKAPNIFIGSKENNQLVGYANELCCDYIMITNGLEINFYHYDEKSESYMVIEEFPIYEQMLTGIYGLSTIEAVPERIPFYKLEEVIKENRIDGSSTEIGDSTPINKAVLSLNLWETILDVREKIPCGRYGIFEIIEDLGVRLVSYGNASGGVFSGPYRSFLINFEGNSQIVSFGMSSYCTWAKQDILKTSLNIAIDTEKSAHHSLQLIIDDNVTDIKNEFYFYHHGKIAIGNIGSGRVSELRQLVEKYCPKLISNDRFYFGKLNNDKLFSFKDDSVRNLIMNLIAYALIRDVYRNEVKYRLNSCKKSTRN